MTYLSLIDKIKILFSVIFDFKSIFIFSILMIIFTILYLLKKISSKRYTISMILSILLVFLISILTNLKVLSKTFDNFMTVFFTGIYFPSIYLYISTLAIVLIAFLFSSINVKIRKVYKVINRIMFVINNIVFVIILNIVAKNKIDIFSINSLYTNTNLVVLLEISMGIFLIWIASLSIAYITNSICDRLAKKKEIKEEVVSFAKEVNNQTIGNNSVLLDNTDKKLDSISIEYPKKVVMDYVSSCIPKTYTLVHDIASYNIYDVVSDTSIVDSVKEENIIPEVKVKEEGLTFDDILNGRVPVSYYDNNKEDIIYNISNPQEVYENNYNNVKLQDLVMETCNEDNSISIKEEVISNNSNIIEETSANNSNVVEENISVMPSIEEITEEIKSKKAVENLITNTISLNELVDEEVLEDVKIIDKAHESLNSNTYTVEDYKKMIGMLNALKKRSVDHNITIDDAVAISLISNYSLDDCLKFKDILESTLN